MRTVTFSVFLFICLHVSVLEGATSWNVAPTGVDSPACGVPASPCKTIQYAIDNRAVSGDRVLLGAGTYPEHLNIAMNLTLAGDGAGLAVIDGSNSGRVVRIGSAKSVSLIDLTVQHGLTSECGGGILNLGSLTLVRTAVSNNRAILVDGTTGQGAGICNQGVLMSVATTISGNSATEAGGIFNVGSMALFLGSTLYGNDSQSYGGAGESFGPLYLVNSTVSGNNAIYGGAFYSVGVLVLNNSTVSANTATEGGGIMNSSTDPHAVVLKNSILAGNFADISPDCHNDLTSQDYNLIGDSSGCSVTGGSHDLVGIPPNLGPLQDNHGPTLTMALLPGSPAIDGANPAGCTTSNGEQIQTDQRGLKRTRQGDSRCDIGAFELVQ